MNKLYPLIKNAFISIAVFLIASFVPLATSASMVSAEDPCVPPPDSQNGVHWPVGSDAATFTYQCTGTYAGQWLNAYYVYDPSTALRTPLYSPDYSYDCTTDTWSMTRWDYSPAQGKYIMSRVAPSSAPNLDTGCPVAASPDATSPGASSSSPTGTAAIDSTGSSSTNTTGNSLTVNANSTNNNTVGMSNGILSQANTGNSFVLGNTTGGSAATGDAQTIANIANLLQTSSNVFGPNTATFVSNINGNVYGDLLFNPAAITNVAPGSSNTSNNAANITLNSNNNTNAQIANNIDVGANSGNATVANNTTGGDATTGNATVVANLMNAINSIITSGQSFVGVVNINGSLNGDILLPQNMLDQLLASNAPNSTNATTNTVNANVTQANNLTTAIANNLNTSANSGNATVANNTNAGSATTGNGTTNVTLLNMTGSNVIGKNNLLVFVNVLGHWVGLIMNAPAGATAASLGGGITNNTLNLNATSTNNNNLGITNNLNAHATSGDATVANNTTGGNARTGNARTAVNILNIAGTNINLSDWFGVLFINVFGDWVGSFGVNTSAGDPIAPAIAVVATDQTPTPAAPNTTAATFARFISGSNSQFGNGSTSNTADANISNATLASSVLGKGTVLHTATGTPTLADNAHASYWIPAIGIAVATLLLLGERFSTLRSKTQA